MDVPAETLRAIGFDIPGHRQARERQAEPIEHGGADFRRDLGVDVAFVGTNGLSLRRGLSTPDETEAAAKSAMVEAADRAIVVTDSSKLGVDHLHSFAPLSAVDLVITDDAADQADRSMLAEAGLEVVYA